MEAFKVLPLRCNHCGGELPVMGRSVTFRCPTCFRYWALTAGGLRPITVYRAVPQSAAAEADGASGHDHPGEPVYLPFWVAVIDIDDLRDQFDRMLGPLLERSDNTSTELDFILRRIETAGSYLVYVPAFYSINMYAYLKIGRLFTRRQPPNRIERSSGLGDPILCALEADEALPLIDFIFFATLPAEIQTNGDLLKHIHLKPADDPRLIEFPFEHSSGSLVSLIGGFAVSARLVEGLRAQSIGAAPGPR
jgi:hypothetical protein